MRKQPVNVAPGGLHSNSMTSFLLSGRLSPYSGPRDSFISFNFNFALIYASHYCGALVIVFHSCISAGLARREEVSN